jgi:hypothetical protein
VDPTDSKFRASSDLVLLRLPLIASARKTDIVKLMIGPSGFAVGALCATHTETAETSGPGNTDVHGVAVGAISRFQ